MKASYSASLLEAWNPNLSAYSMSIPYGEVRLDLLCSLVRLRLHLQRVSRWGGQSLFERFQQVPLR